MKNTLQATQPSGQTSRIIFFGTEAFSAVTLQALIDAQYSIAAVVTKPDSQKGRGRKIIESEVKHLAVQHNIPVWQPAKLRDITDDIIALQPVAGVLVSYGKIIPQSTIELFTPGIINIHPSLLPEYRGPSPIEAAILSGQHMTGVSIMQLSAAMDAGPVYTQIHHQLSGNETQESLYQTLGVKGATALLESLPSILDHTLVPTAQNDAEATYCSLIAKNDSILDWNKPAEQLDREIRAYQSWPKSRAALGPLDVIIRTAHVAPGDGIIGDIIVENTTLMVQTSDKRLSIEVIQPLGKKEMPVQAFLAGYKHLFN
jgi:methionyl-tRNA formyltransferase